MTDRSPDLPSLRQLWRATAIAAVIAAALLVCVILPAEYGIDPTGVGRRLAILRPRAVTADEGAAATDTGEGMRAGPGQALIRSKTAFRTDEMSLVLESGEGGEIKAVMAQGEHFIYSWVSDGGAVDVDMHGEAFNARDEEYTSYWKDEEQAGDHGAFTAPVAGRHGWFWQNLNDTPVTIKLKTSGFYEQLIRP